MHTSFTTASDFFLNVSSKHFLKVVSTTILQVIISHTMIFSTYLKPHLKRVKEQYDNSIFEFSRLRTTLSLFSRGHCHLVSARYSRSLLVLFARSQYYCAYFSHASYFFNILINASN